ncbi:MAG: NUDIX hydrolase [Pseudomonadales bacterium]|nr:NUDIX hydrolase [Pseudomonadales bacterium]
MKKPRHRTVRCILRREDQFFLVIHNNRLFQNKGKWGLPGGRIEPGEDFEQTAIRELKEELYISVHSLYEGGDYRYKGYYHKVFAADFDEPIIRFDRYEILKIGWHSLDEIRDLEASGRLHAGFELEAILDYSGGS